jgi:hypothetical protein
MYKGNAENLNPDEIIMKLKSIINFLEGENGRKELSDTSNS